MLQNLKSKDDEVRELINEVSKPRPNQSKVKLLARRLNIEFSTDPIEQMALVLKKIELSGLEGLTG